MKLKPEEVKKIAVFRALQLGDMLCCIPAIRTLRHAYPEAEIVLLGLPWAIQLVERFPHYFNRFIHFPGYPGLPEQEYQAKDFLHFLQQMQNEAFDLLLQMQGKGTIVNPVMIQFNAKCTAGFYNEESYVNSGLFMPYPNHGHEISRHLALMQHLGLELQGSYLEFPVLENDQRAFEQLLLPIESKKYVCIHPGSRGAWRQWPPQFFATMADYCIEQGCTAIITGTKEESTITREVIKCMKHPSIDLTGQTSLGVVGLLIRDAFALISNCTGVSHIAAATQTPSVVISMDGEPERWAPLNTAIHYTIDWTRNQHFEQALLALAAIFEKHTQTAAENSVH